MRQISILATLAITTIAISISHAVPPPTIQQQQQQQPIALDASPLSTDITIDLFAELEELARIVDISYCVGTTGIHKPFSCASRCDEFPSFELVTTFNTGPLMSDSCGYIAVDHGRERVGRARRPRVLVAFRGTYSVANTIVDLSTVPQEYVPYPGSPHNETSTTKSSLLPGRRHLRKLLDLNRPGFLKSKDEDGAEDEPEPRPTCRNCTVHTGFWTSWKNTRLLVVPHLEYLREKHPDYELHLVGHSLGGAVAALAGLEFDGLGWNPHVTTFGEPRVGNSGLRDWIDATFALPSDHDSTGNKHMAEVARYRRVTHVDDPVPLLPLQEWGYRAHAGEVFISKAALQPTVSDIRLCYGDEDVDCLAGAEADEKWFDAVVTGSEEILSGQVRQASDESEESFGKDGDEEAAMIKKRWSIPIPARYKMWQLFFAHRDYFWRLGLCVPGGDPLDWGRDRYRFEGGEDGEGTAHYEDEL